MKAKRKKFVFIGISVLGGSEMFESVEVSTTLNGLCRLLRINYERVARAFRRTGIQKEDEGELEVSTDKATEVDRGKIKILKKELDVIWGRGDVELPKKLKIAASGGAMRGYKGNDGLLHSTPEKKRTLADDIVVHKQRIASEGADPEYEEDEL